MSFEDSFDEDDSWRKDPIKIAKHIENLKTYVISKEICFEVGNQPDIDLDWLRENLGRFRGHSLYKEAEEGWLDYFEGDWFAERRNDYVVYWIGSDEKRILFKLRWGGIPSKDLYENNWFIKKGRIK